MAPLGGLASSSDTFNSGVDVFRPPAGVSGASAKFSNLRAPEMAQRRLGWLQLKKNLDVARVKLNKTFRWSEFFFVLFDVCDATNQGNSWFD